MQKRQVQRTQSGGIRRFKQTSQVDPRKYQKATKIVFKNGNEQKLTEEALGACKRQNIDPSELVYTPLSVFEKDLEQQNERDISPSMHQKFVEGQNTSEIKENLAEVRYQHYENRRKANVCKLFDYISILIGDSKLKQQKSIANSSTQGGGGTTLNVNDSLQNNGMQSNPFRNKKMSSTSPSKPKDVPNTIISSEYQKLQAEEKRAKATQLLNNLPKIAQSSRQRTTVKDDDLYGRSSNKFQGVKRIKRKSDVMHKNSDRYGFRSGGSRTIHNSSGVTQPPNHNDSILSAVNDNSNARRGNLIKSLKPKHPSKFPSYFQTPSDNLFDPLRSIGTSESSKRPKAFHLTQPDEHTAKHLFQSHQASMKQSKTFRPNNESTSLVHFGGGSTTLTSAAQVKQNHHNYNNNQSSIFQNTANPNYQTVQNNGGSQQAVVGNNQLQVRMKHQNAAQHHSFFGRSPRSIAGGGGTKNPSPFQSIISSPTNLQGIHQQNGGSIMMGGVKQTTMYKSTNSFETEGTFQKIISRNQISTCEVPTSKYEKAQYLAQKQENRVSRVLSVREKANILQTDRSVKNELNQRKYVQKIKTFAKQQRLEDELRSQKAHFDDLRRKDVRETTLSKDRSLDLKGWERFKNDYRETQSRLEEQRRTQIESSQRERIRLNQHLELKQQKRKEDEKSLDREIMQSREHLHQLEEDIREKTRRYESALKETKDKCLRQFENQMSTHKRYTEHSEFKLESQSKQVLDKFDTQVKRNKKLQREMTRNVDERRSSAAQRFYSVRVESEQLRSAKHDFLKGENERYASRLKKRDQILTQIQMENLRRSESRQLREQDVSLNQSRERRKMQEFQDYVLKKQFCKNAFLQQESNLSHKMVFNAKLNGQSQEIDSLKQSQALSLQLRQKIPDKLILEVRRRKMQEQKEAKQVNAMKKFNEIQNLLTLMGKTTTIPPKEPRLTNEEQS